MIVAVLLILAIYSAIALEAWTLSHPPGRGTGPRTKRAPDLADLEVTAVDPLRLPPAGAALTDAATHADARVIRVPRVRAAGPEVWRRS